MPVPPGRKVPHPDYRRPALELDLGDLPREARLGEHFATPRTGVIEGARDHDGHGVGAVVLPGQAILSDLADGIG